MRAIRGTEVDYAFLSETSSFTNIADYIKHYNLTGTKYRARVNQWIKENKITELRYKGEEKFEKGDEAFYMFLDIKERIITDEHTPYVNWLKKRKYISEDLTWKTKKTINQITLEFLL